MNESKKTLIPGNPRDAKEYFKQKICFTTGPVEVMKFRDDGEDFVLVDVREASDFAKGHPVGALSLPRDQWDTFAGLSKGKVNILLCYSAVCHLAAKAAVKFAAHGYPVMEMDGGFQAWEQHHFPVDVSADAQQKSA